MKEAHRMNIAFDSHKRYTLCSVAWEMGIFGGSQFDLYKPTSMA